MTSWYMQSHGQDVLLPITSWSSMQSHGQDVLLSEMWRGRQSHLLPMICVATVGKKKFGFFRVVPAPAGARVCVSGSGWSTSEALLSFRSAPATILWPFNEVGFLHIKAASYILRPVNEVGFCSTRENCRRTTFVVYAERCAARDVEGDENCRRTTCVIYAERYSTRDSENCRRTTNVV